MHRVVKAPAEADAENAAYSIAAPLVRKAVEKKYPNKDMLVLQRYGVTINGDFIKMRMSDGEVMQFVFNGADEGEQNKTESHGKIPGKLKSPLRPDTYGDRNCVFIVDGTTEDAVKAWSVVTKKHKDALSQKLTDYCDLIDTTRYFEDVLAIWPEAEQVRTLCGAAALTVMVKDEVIERIQADVKNRAAAGEKNTAA